MITNGVTEYDLFTVDSDDEYRYVDYEDGVKVIGYSGLREYLEIPEVLGGKQVLGIGVNDEGYPGSRRFQLLIPKTVAFIDPKCRSTWVGGLFFKNDNEKFCIDDGILYSKDGKNLYFGFQKQIDHLIIRDGVETIGEYAFSNQSFTSVVIPPSVKRVGSFAFGFVKNTIEIPDNVEKIGDFIANRYTLTQKNKSYRIVDGCVYTKDGKTLIQCVQKNCTEVIVPDTVEDIRPYSFYEYDIRKLDLGIGVKKIGEKAFYRAAIKTIRIPDQLEELADNAFGYNKCKSIRVGKKNPHFNSDGMSLFAVNPDGSKRLLKCYKSREEEYIIPEGVTSISKGAFSDCTSMEKLSLPTSLERYDESAFVSSLKSDYSRNVCAVKKLIIPENVTELVIPFERIPFEIKENNRAYYMEEGILYHKTEDTLEIVAAKDVRGELLIKKGVTKIKAYAFAGCKQITKVVCNDELREIEHNAFSNGWDKYQIEDIILNNGLESIDYLAFCGNYVGKVHVPASVRYICLSAFNKCKNAEFEVDEENPYYSSENGVLYNKSKTELRFVPKNREYNRFTLPETVTEIGCAFRGCEKIKEIVIPKSVQCICRAAFDCKVRDLYFEGNIKAFDYTGIDLWGGVTIHADAGTGAVQYVEWIRSLRGDTKIGLIINGAEDLSALTKDFDVVLNDAGITIVKVLKEKQIVTIPETIGDHKVTKIADRAFEVAYSQNESVEEIIIPDTVTVIGANAFSNRASLKRVTLPKGIKVISKAMFCNCRSLEEIMIPDGVEKVCEAAFFGCEKIGKIYFPSSITEISDLFLADEDGRCKDLYTKRSMVFVVEPGSYAEEFLKAYKSEGYCKQLAVIYADQANAPITEDEKKALEYLEYRVQEGGTVAVNFKLFWEKEHPDVRIPNTIQGMPVTKLSIGQIHGSMQRLFIPENILSIRGITRYDYGMNMKTIEVAEGNPNYWSDGQALYTKDKTELIRMFDFRTEEYEVCSSTKVIQSGAFGQCMDLKKLILPEGLQTIQKDAFYDCSKLGEIVGVEHVSTIAEGVLDDTPYIDKSLVIMAGTVLQKYNAKGEKCYKIPAGTTEIANNAFYLSPNTYNSDDDVLEEIVIPESVRRIGANAFSGRRKLRSVNIPDGVKKIEENAFKDCFSLSMIVIPQSCNDISPDAFPVCDESSSRTLKVPSFYSIEVDTANSTYKSMDGVLYSKNGKILVLVPANYKQKVFIVPETVEVIGRNAFAYNKDINRVVLPDTVKTIAAYAFFKCDKLEEINLERVENVERFAFADCINLRSVSLNLETISDYAFSNCRRITDVIFTKVRTIGDDAFYGCGLTTIHLPDGLENIGNRAFAGCKLKEVTVPKTVLKTGNESFSGCLRITIYDTIDPEAKPCTEHFDDCNGSPNSIVGFIGIGPARAMWDCAANHLWLNHEIIVRSADSNEIKYKVWMGANPAQRSYYCTLTSSWGKNGSFNFAALDDSFSKIKGTYHRIRVAINRLRYPVELSESKKTEYSAYLVRAAKDLVKMCIERDDMETMLFCEPLGVIKKNNIDELLDCASKSKASQFSAYLIDYKNKYFGNSSGKTKMLSLSDKAEEIWVVSKSSSTKLK